MSIAAERKQALIKEYAQADKDTGSPEVQVAILPSGSPTSPSTSRRTRRTTIRGAGF